MTTRLLTLIIKEFKAIWKDPRSRMIVTIMPIIQLIVFANAVTMEVKNIDMLVLDNSRSYYSRDLNSSNKALISKKQAWLWKYLLILPYL